DGRRGRGEHRVPRQPLGAVPDPAPGRIRRAGLSRAVRNGGRGGPSLLPIRTARDRKSTRLNSSHVAISYAVFCLKKKKKNRQQAFIRKKKNKNIYILKRT